MTVVDVEPRPGGSLALRVVQAGAIAVVVAVTTFHAFELDRFFVPKELVLHLAAALAGLLAIRALWRMSVTRVDLLLAGYLGLSAFRAAGDESLAGDARAGRYRFMPPSLLDRALVT